MVHGAGERDFALNEQWIAGSNDGALAKLCCRVVTEMVRLHPETKRAAELISVRQEVNPCHRRTVVENPWSRTGKGKERESFMINPPTTDFLTKRKATLHSVLIQGTVLSLAYLPQATDVTNHGPNFWSVRYSLTGPDRNKTHNRKFTTKRIVTAPS